MSASAAALTGTWSGRIFSVGRSFDLPYVYTGDHVPGQFGNPNVPLQPPPSRPNFWNIPATPNGVTCGQLSIPCAISWSNFNIAPNAPPPPPGFSVTRFNLVTEAADPSHPNDPNFNTQLAQTSNVLGSLQLTATGSTFTGTMSDDVTHQVFASVDGIAVSNEFFLLRMLISQGDDDPACYPARMQAFASLRTDDPDGVPRLSITGSGGTGRPGCPRPHHDFFSGGFRRQ